MRLGSSRTSCQRRAAPRPRPNLPRVARSTDRSRARLSPPLCRPPATQAPRRHSAMMIKPLARALVAVVIAAVACVSWVRAEDSLVGSASRTGSLVTLSMVWLIRPGPPFPSACFNGMEVAVLTCIRKIAGASPGRSRERAQRAVPRRHHSTARRSTRAGRSSARRATSRSRRCSRSSREGAGDREDGRDERHARRARPR